MKNVHILQSPSWQKFQNLLSTTTFIDSGSGWSYLAILEKTSVGHYLSVPRGPFISTPKAMKSALKSLRILARQKNAFFIRIEPEISTPELKNLKKVNSINPEHTWVLDLSPDKSTLLASMKQNNRNLFRSYAKKGIKITHTTDPRKITHLTKLLKNVAAHNKISIFSENYLKKQLEAGFATLYLAEYQKKIIAAAMVYDTEATRYYAHAAADYEHRSLSAGTSLLVQMILDAKEGGKKSFDFWGITLSDDPRDPWFGFTKFKKSFGGRVVSYPGTYDLILNHPKYTLYSLLRPINRFLRKLKP